MKSFAKTLPLLVLVVAVVAQDVAPHRSDASPGITLTGAVTGTGSGSIVTTISNRLTYVMVSFSSSSPAQNTTRYAGCINGLGASLTESTVYQEIPLLAPVKIRSVAFKVFVQTTLGTAGQQITNFIMTGTSGATANRAWTNDWSATLQEYSTTNLSFTLNPGDRLAWRMDYPQTWTQPATPVYGTCVIGFE